MFATELLFESSVTTALGYVHLIGTASGERRTRDRVMDEYALVYSVSGAADYRDDLGTAQALHPGSGLVVFPGLRHSYGALPGAVWVEFYVVFDGPVFQLLEAQGLIDRTAPVTEVGPVEEWLPRFLAIADRARPVTQAEALIMVGDFIQLLLVTLARAPRRPSWLARARSLIDDTVTGPADFDLVAAELGTSYETFRKRFRREGGEPPARYRNRRRVDLAGDLLASTSLSLRQIAATLGYTDEFHLSRRFKAMTGQSPRAYRAHRR